MNLNDIFYELSNDVLVAAIDVGDVYEILFVKGFSGTGSISGKITMNSGGKGQPFSLIPYDYEYMWVVGRVVDGSSEYPFHHLKTKRYESSINEVIYKQRTSSTTTKYLLMHSDKKYNNQKFLWSCGYYDNGGTPYAIYSVLQFSSNNNLHAA